MGNQDKSITLRPKAGMAGFTKAPAREVGNRGITVNCVAPGFIDTDMTKELPETQRPLVGGQRALRAFGLGR